jgi:serine/threonine protein kinase
MPTDTKPTTVREVGAEPLPGYRLLEPLGRGGFGEVWKCEVPGGLLKAIKFVRGPVNERDADRNSAELEFEAIQRVKSVRHPFLLSIERVEVLAGELILVMELADRNLADRFAECHAAGQPGIPRDELLGYLMEAAEALDVINFHHGLQHLDVKPANLFVVGNHLKVADFGLVNTLDDVSADGTPRRMGGLTPLYVAPEMLEGHISRHSDQYSLAIVYQELLTGTPPFSGNDAQQIMLAHLVNQPDLTPLPQADWAVVARALAKVPDQRFPSCLHFLQALVFGPDSVPMDGGPARLKPAAPSSLRPSTFRRPPEPLPSEAQNETIVTNLPRGAGKQAKAANGSAGRAPEAPAPEAPAEPETFATDRTARADQPALPGYEILAQLGSGLLGETCTVRRTDGRERVAQFLPAPGAGLELDEGLLGRLGSLQDPALPSLEVARTTTGRVVLLSDPLERTILDRYRECVAAGLKGIPRAELLDHLAKAAEALDGLRRRHGLWHLGLSPRAVCLADGGIKLGDFGLAQLVWLPRRRLAPHFSRRYAAPELLKGIPNATCDSYSLAMIFAEMLAGVHPWPNRLRSRSGSSAGRSGSSAGLLKPDLDWLPASDRAVIALALDPDPRQRFAGCTKLLEALGPTAHSRSVLEIPPVRELPVFLPAANLKGGSERLTEVPSLHNLVTQLVLAETGAAGAASDDKLSYLLLPGRALESRFPVRLLPGMIPLKMAVFCEKWEGKIISQDERSFVVRMYESENFWQRCLRQKIGLEVRLDLQAPGEGQVHVTEALVTIRPFGSGKNLTASKLDEVGPLLLASLRGELQNIPDQRRQVRWPCSRALEVYEVRPDQTLEGPQPAMCKDISFGSIAFVTPQRPTAKLAYVHFCDSAELANCALLVRIVRTEPCPGGFRVGAAFAGTVAEGV